MNSQTSVLDKKFVKIKNDFLFQQKTVFRNVTLVVKSNEGNLLGQSDNPDLDSAWKIGSI